MTDSITSTNHLRQLLALPPAQRTAAATFESVGEPAPPAPAADTLARIDAAMKKIPADEIADPAEFRRALAVLFEHGEQSITKLRNDPAAQLSKHETFAVEAVIRTDGTRPSLLLRDGVPPENHPLAGAWANDFSANKNLIRATASAIGRIEPNDGTGSNFFGTGWVVDKAAGLVLTNIHVVEAFMRRATTLAQVKDGKIRVFDGVYIDFVAETQSTAHNRHKVTEATLSGIDGDGFQRLDIALLKIEPTSGSQPITSEIKVIADLDWAQGNGLNSLAVIGYPGAPVQTTGVVEGVDWGWVNATLFGSRYGLKRIAPGIVHKPLGFRADDPRQWIFGHDATTLGGSSGSPIIAWKDGGGSFGIHFAGTSVDSNFAHAMAKCVDVLKRLGIKVVEP
jgi:S1-C subfamily serine protease